MMLITSSMLSRPTTSYSKTGLERIIVASPSTGIIYRATLTFSCLNMFETQSSNSDISATNTRMLPHQWTTPTYGAKVQYAKAALDLPLLDKIETKFIQSVTDNFLYYARAVGPTMLPALNKIAAQESAQTAKTKEKPYGSWTMLPLIPTPAFTTMPATWSSMSHLMPLILLCSMLAAK